MLDDNIIKLQMNTNAIIMFNAADDEQEMNMQKESEDNPHIKTVLFFEAYGFSFSLMTSSFIRIRTI